MKNDIHNQRVCLINKSRVSFRKHAEAYNPEGYVFYVTSWKDPIVLKQMLRDFMGENQLDRFDRWKISLCPCMLRIKTIDALRDALEKACSLIMKSDL